MLLGQWKRETPLFDKNLTFRARDLDLAFIQSLNNGLNPYFGKEQALKIVESEAFDANCNNILRFYEK